MNPKIAMKTVRELLGKFYAFDISPDGLTITIPFLSFNIVIKVIEK